MTADHGSVLAGRDEGAADYPSAAPSSSGAEVSVIDARKVFGVTKALDGCTFSAKRGEIHAIVGGNGCGKSTLAKVMSGVLPADSGQVSILGHTPRTPLEARKAGIATVFQEILVADECSVVDNLFVGSDGLFVKSLPTSEKVNTARALMRELTDSEIDPEMPVGGLPLGTKQWITIGRALLCKPQILILDESSAALDLDSTERLFGKMRELRDEGAAVIIVTHRIAELIRISDRATVMRDGRDVGVLEKGEITEKNLLRLMTGDRDLSEAGEQEAHRALSDQIVLRANGVKIWPDGEEIEFDLLRGEIVGVAGLDGQGQNEFVRALSGVQPAEQGLPLGKNDAGEFIEIKDLADAEACHIAYVSGDRKHEGTFPNLSIFENLLIPLYRKHTQDGRLGVISWADLSGIFDWFVDRLSIKVGQKSNKITALSGGNQQKVLIGRSFALQPNILVLNDPARGIDVETKSELYKHLRDFASRGHSVVFMSSELEEFIGLCSRVIVFRHGSIFDSFSVDEIDPDRILEAMFGQTEGKGAHRHRKADQADRSRSAVVNFENEKEILESKVQVDRIKIVESDREVESDKEKDVETGWPNSDAAVGHIKVVYFDD
jgi:ribose transport system ATP-binding protein